jgi:hypothetical protein
LDAKEGENLGWALRFLGIDDQTELTNDGLCEGQVPRHVFLGVGYEKEVVEEADIVDALLGESEVDHGQELRAHTRGRAEPEGHVRELVQAAFEAEAEELTH